MPIVNVGANCGTLDSPGLTGACVYSYSKDDDPRVLYVNNAVASINNFISTEFDTGPFVAQYSVYLAWDPTMDVTKVPGFNTVNLSGYTKFIKGDPRVRYIYSDKEKTDLGVETPVTYTNGGASKNLNRPLVILKNIDRPDDGFFLIGRETPGVVTPPGGAGVDTVTIKPAYSWNVTPPTNYVTSTSDAYIFKRRAGCALPTVNFTVSAWLKMSNREYDGSIPGKKQYYLTRDGTVYDINQPVADISKPWKFSFQISKSADQTKYVVVPVSPQGWPSGAVFSLVPDASSPLTVANNAGVQSVTGIISVTIIASGEFGAVSLDFRADTLQPTQTSDVVDGLSEYTIFTCINSPTQSVVMGWCSAITNKEDDISPQTQGSGSDLGTYKFKTRSNYFSFMPFGPKQGYFNLIPVTSESLAPPSTSADGFSGQYFLMFSGDNAQMFYVDSTGAIKTKPTPSTFYKQQSTDARGSPVPGSLMSSTSISNTYLYGAWRFVNIQDDSTSPKRTFALAYTPPVSLVPTSPGSTQSLNPQVGITSGITYYVKYDGGAITNTTVTSLSATSTGTSTKSSTFTSTSGTSTVTSTRLGVVGGLPGSTVTSTVPITSTFVSTTPSSVISSTVARFTCTVCTATADSGGACFPVAASPTPAPSPSPALAPVPSLAGKTFISQSGYTFTFGPADGQGTVSKQKDSFTAPFTYDWNQTTNEILVSFTDVPGISLKSPVILQYDPTTGNINLKPGTSNTNTLNGMYFLQNDISKIITIQNGLFTYTDLSTLSGVNNISNAPMTNITTNSFTVNGVSFTYTNTTITTSTGKVFEIPPSPSVPTSSGAPSRPNDGTYGFYPNIIISGNGTKFTSQANITPGLSFDHVNITVTSPGTFTIPKPNGAVVSVTYTADTITLGSYKTTLQTTSVPPTTSTAGNVDLVLGTGITSGLVRPTANPQGGFGVV